VAGARFGIVFLPESLEDFGPLCREAESTGFDWLGVADSQSVFHELYVALTLAALETSRIRLGPLVTNPQTRHLVVTASAIASLDELSGGRVALGLGSGDSAIYTLGAPPATVAGLEEAITTASSPAARRCGQRGGPRARRRVPIHLTPRGRARWAGRPDRRRRDRRPRPDAGGDRASLAAIERGGRPGARWLTSTCGGSPRRSVADSAAAAVDPSDGAGGQRQPRLRFTLGATWPRCWSPSARARTTRIIEIAGAGNAGLTDRFGLTSSRSTASRDRRRSTAWRRSAARWRPARASS
jgi:5,10-methylenetetrahydromethanopterin reductase